MVLAGNLFYLVGLVGLVSWLPRRKVAMGSSPAKKAIKFNAALARYNCSIYVRAVAEVVVDKELAL